MSERGDLVAADFFRRAHEAEAGLLSCGFHDPAHMRESAGRLGITSHHFADGNHVAVFSSLIGHADLGIEPSLPTVRTDAEREGATWADAGFPDDLSRIVFTEGSAALVEFYARQVAEATYRRDRCRELQRQMNELMGAELTHTMSPDLLAESGIVVRRSRRIA